MTQFPMKPSGQNPYRQAYGFTLTEVLVVIAIIAVLALITMSVSRRVMDNARSANCISNLRNLGAAALTYSTENNGILPPICQLDYGKAWTTGVANRWWPSFLANSTSPPSELVYTNWRCPEVRDDEFQKLSTDLVYSSYVPLKPVITFLTEENPTGSMRLASIRNPEKIWMFGDGGRPLGAADSNKYMTVGAIERYGKNWATSNRPACRHNGGRYANYVACDGHAESLSRKDIENLEHGAFGKFNGAKVEY
jgi:prepilin-type N-terminal cleavage/methylation domain-containing protein/prepilin-type processing-associated H-X9-DG protein